MRNQLNEKQVQALITKAVSAVEARAAYQLAVSGNHQVQNLPTATTAITTGAGAAMGSASATSKGGKGFRIIAVGTPSALNTLQAVIQPTLTFTVNGINTKTAVLPSVALPGNTSDPSVGGFAGVIETAGIAGFPAFKQGDTVTAALSLAGSVTGGSQAIDSINLAMQEVF